MAAPWADYTGWNRGEGVKRVMNGRFETESESRVAIGGVSAKMHASMKIRKLKATCAAWASRGALMTFGWPQSLLSLRPRPKWGCPSSSSDHSLTAAASLCSFARLTLDEEKLLKVFPCFTTSTHIFAMWSPWLCCTGSPRPRRGWCRRRGWTGKPTGRWCS